MEFDEFLNGIGVPEAVRRELDQITVSEAEADRYLLEFEKSPEGFYAIIRQKENYRLWFLKLYLLFAWRRYPEYGKRGIPDQIYFDTFHDMMNWVENCQRDYHETGLEEYDWLRLHLQMKLFQIGRLQYEVVRNEETVLNLHIPQGEPLDYDKCVASLQAAGAFFHHDFKEIVCHSWLLSPALREILEEDSNIIRFQSLFTVYRLDTESREAEERTFHNRLQEDPNRYPETTRLQKAMKEYLCKGGRIGSGYGRVNTPIPAPKPEKKTKKQQFPPEPKTEETAGKQENHQDLIQGQDKEPY